jgi:hypothetical protein
MSRAAGRWRGMVAFHPATHGLAMSALVSVGLLACAASDPSRSGQSAGTPASAAPASAAPAPAASSPLLSEGDAPESSAAVEEAPASTSPPALASPPEAPPRPPLDDAKIPKGKGFYCFMWEHFPSGPNVWGEACYRTKRECSTVLGRAPAGGKIGCNPSPSASCYTTKTTYRCASTRDGCEREYAVRRAAWYGTDEEGSRCEERD